MIMRTESVPWIVIDIQPLPGHRLHVRFIDGTEGDVDLSRMVFSDKAGVFVALRDPARFAEARVTDGVVTWPGDLDLAPDAMYDEIRGRGPWHAENAAPSLAHGPPLDQRPPRCRATPQGAVASPARSRTP